MKTQVKALKVKIKSLAAEARIIRLEEQKALGRKKPDPVLYLSLRYHRTKDVRGEQRASLLAYAFVRGKAYAAAEKPAATNPPDMVRVKKLIEKFGGQPYQPYKVADEELTAWRVGTLSPHPFAPPAKPEVV